MLFFINCFALLNRGLHVLDCHEYAPSLFFENLSFKAYDNLSFFENISFKSDLAGSHNLCYNDDNATEFQQSMFYKNCDGSYEQTKAHTHVYLTSKVCSGLNVP